MSELATLLRHYMLLNGFSAYRLARLSGRSQTSISRLLGGQRKASRAMIRDLARGLGAPESELQAAAGHQLEAPLAACLQVQPLPILGPASEPVPQDQLGSGPAQEQEFLLLCREIARYLPDDRRFSRLPPWDREFLLAYLRGVLYNLQLLEFIQQRR